MTEHEKLKEICDKIGYNIEDNWFQYTVTYWFKDCYDCNWTDIKQIIFSKPFMWRFVMEYIHTFRNTFYADLCLNHLNNPVDYLYNLIK